MNPLWRGLGIVLYILVWPLLWSYLYNSKRCRVLVVNKSKILVTKDWLGTHKKWVLPGGGIRKNESPQQAASRELFEETGIMIQLKQLSLMNEEPFRHQIHSFYCYYFLLDQPQLPAISLPTREIMELSWVDSTELKYTNAQPDVLRALELWKGLRSFVTMKPGSN